MNKRSFIYRFEKILLICGMWKRYYLRTVTFFISFFWWFIPIYGYFYYLTQTDGKAKSIALLLVNDLFFVTFFFILSLMTRPSVPAKNITYIMSRISYSLYIPFAYMLLSLQATAYTFLFSKLPIRAAFFPDDILLSNIFFIPFIMLFYAYTLDASTITLRAAVFFALKTIWKNALTFLLFIPIGFYALKAITAQITIFILGLFFVPLFHTAYIQLINFSLFSLVFAPLLAIITLTFYILARSPQKAS